MDTNLFEGFNLTPEKAIEFSGFLRDYIFVDIDNLDKDNINYIAKKLISLLSEYNSEDIQILHSESSVSKNFAAILKQNGFSSIQQRKMNMGDTQKKIDGERKLEALGKIESELGSEISNFISGNKIDWKGILTFTYQKNEDIEIFGRKLTRNFIRYVYEKDLDFEYIYFQCFGYSVADKSIEQKETEFNSIFGTDNQTPKLTIFIGERSFGNMLKYSQNKRRAEKRSNPDLKNKIFLLPKRETERVIENHKINTKGRNTNLIRSSIKLINSLSDIYFGQNRLFTLELQEQAEDIIAELTKSRGQNSVKNSTHNQLITEIELLIKKIKYIQIWRVISKVRTYIMHRVSLYETQDNKVDNIATKRRVWGRFLFETLDRGNNLHKEINALILDISEFIESTVGREYFQSIEEILRIDSDKLMQIATTGFDGGSLLEFILVDTLSSIDGKAMNGKFTKGNKKLDSHGKIDFVFKGKSSHLGYQLFAGSRNSTQKKKKIRILRDIQSKINEKENENIIITKQDGKEIVFKREEFPETLLFAHLEMNTKERKLLQEYHKDFDVRKQSSIITHQDYQDSLSDKILSFSHALREVTYILHTLNGQKYKELLNGGLKIRKGVYLLGTTHEGYVEIMVKEEGRLIGTINIFDTRGMRIKRKKHKEKQRPKQSRENGRSPRTRENWK